MTVKNTATAIPPIVDLPQWQQALATQQQLESDLAAQAKSVAAARRRLPMTPVQGDYTFTGAKGETSFVELFDGHRQLVAYHFMFGPDWEHGCPFCTRYMKELGNDFAAYIAERDTRFVLISRADYAKLGAHAASTGIETPWYSAPTEFSEEMDAVNDSFGDLPGFTTFFRDDNDVIYRTYRPGGEGEPAVPGDLILHLTPYGMQQNGDDSPEGWPQSFDQE